MQRITISLSDELAEAFDAMIGSHGYTNRSEAIRDVLQAHMQQQGFQRRPADACIATVTYVYNHHERTLNTRLADIQHDAHDLSVATMHVHLDHENCLETAVLRGAGNRVQACAQSLLTGRGVRHGSVHYVALHPDPARHVHGPSAAPHSHDSPD